MQVYECLNLAKLPNLAQRQPNDTRDGAAAQIQQQRSVTAPLFGGGTWGLTSVSSQGVLGPGKSMKIIS